MIAKVRPCGCQPPVGICDELRDLRDTKARLYERVMDLEDDLVRARTDYDRRSIRRDLADAREAYRQVRAEYRAHREEPRAT